MIRPTASPCVFLSILRRPLTALNVGNNERYQCVFMPYLLWLQSPLIRTFDQSGETQTLIERNSVLQYFFIDGFKLTTVTNSSGGWKQFTT